MDDASAVGTENIVKIVEEIERRIFLFYGIAFQKMNVTEWSGLISALPCPIIKP